MMESQAFRVLPPLSPDLPPPPRTPLSPRVTAPHLQHKEQSAFVILNELPSEGHPATGRSSSPFRGRGFKESSSTRIPQPSGKATPVHVQVQSRSRHQSPSKIPLSRRSSPSPTLKEQSPAKRVTVKAPLPRSTAASPSKRPVPPKSPGRPVPAARARVISSQVTSTLDSYNTLRRKPKPRTETDQEGAAQTSGNPTNGTAPVVAKPRTNGVTSNRNGTLERKDRQNRVAANNAKNSKTVTNGKDKNGVVKKNGVNGKATLSENGNNTTKAATNGVAEDATGTTGSNEPSAPLAPQVASEGTKPSNEGGQTTTPTAPVEPVIQVNTALVEQSMAGPEEGKQQASAEPMDTLPPPAGFRGGDSGSDGSTPDLTTVGTGDGAPLVKMGVVENHVVRVEVQGPGVDKVLANGSAVVDRAQDRLQTASAVRETQDIIQSLEDPGKAQIGHVKGPPEVEVQSSNSRVSFSSPEVQPLATQPPKPLSLCGKIKNGLCCAPCRSKMQSKPPNKKMLVVDDPSSKKVKDKSESKPATESAADSGGRFGLFAKLFSRFKRKTGPPPPRLAKKEPTRAPPVDNRRWWSKLNCCKSKKRETINRTSERRSCWRSVFCLDRACCKRCTRGNKAAPEPKKGNREKAKTSRKSSFTGFPKLEATLVEHNSVMRGAIPVLPLPLAWICLILNVFLPGIGTLMSGLLCLCFGKPRFSVNDTTPARLGSFCVNVIVAISQIFTILFCLVGWGWSIWWGVIMLRLARKNRRIKQAEKSAETPSPAPKDKDVEKGQSTKR